MNRSRTVLVSIVMTGVVATGCGLWALFAPGEERKKDILKNLPEANPVLMEKARNRNALILQALKDAAETNDNVTQGNTSRK